MEVTSVEPIWVLTQDFSHPGHVAVCLQCIGCCHSWVKQTWCNSFHTEWFSTNKSHCYEICTWKHAQVKHMEPSEDSCRWLVRAGCMCRDCHFLLAAILGHINHPNTNHTDYLRHAFKTLDMPKKNSELLPKLDAGFSLVLGILNKPKNWKLLFIAQWVSNP